MIHFKPSTRTCPVQASFIERDHREAQYLESLPVCDGCGLPINEDYYYNVYGELYCEDCLNNIFRHSIDEYTEVQDEY